MPPAGIFVKWRTLGLFDELQPVSEWICREEPPTGGDFGVPLNRRKFLGQCIDLRCQKTRMGLVGRGKGVLDAQMQFERTQAEPTATAGGKCFGLGHLDQTQQAGPERAGLIFAVFRDRDLDMIELKRHRA